MLWYVLEADALDTYGVGAQFTNRELAHDLGISPHDASRMIDAYLSAQRAVYSQTRYVLTREGRTSAAVWTIGTRTQDARQIIGQFGNDVRCTMHDAVLRDLARIAHVNPRARASIESQLMPLLDGVVSIIEVMIATVGWQLDDD